ncbi:ATP synthase subunit I [Cellulophaga baltica]|uniref:ATP synthase subunit I n=1 Tax=Cellulophaga baltica TaxID=76594 RepID=UPI0024957B19|nr:ATP synthase subunit I [Cellulophaga baltica]
MSDLISILLGFFGGTAIGALFFGGLWFTTKKMLTSKWPALMYLGSLILRVGFTLLGFYYIGQDNWKIILIGLLGFISMRFIVLRMTRTENLEPIELDKEY